MQSEDENNAAGGAAKKRKLVDVLRNEPNSEKDDDDDDDDDDIDIDDNDKELTEERFHDIKDDAVLLAPFCNRVVTRLASMHRGDVANVNLEEFARLVLLNKKIEEWKKKQNEDENASARSIERVADIDYGIVDSPLIFKNDLKRFSERIDGLFTFFKQKNKEKYMSPYFPMIQSSGMGKTKLLYEYHNNQKKQKKTTIMVLCSYRAEKGSTPGIYDRNELRVESDDLSDKTAHEKERKRIASYLNQLVEGKVGQVVILFDEAQKLLANENFAFRCIRCWLRDNKKNQKLQQVVAVFAGTTSRLSFFFREPKRKQYSRDPKSRPKEGTEETEGTELYEPFYQICTIGVLRHKTLDAAAHSTNDLVRAAKYGRPLFALLALEGKLTDESLIPVRSRILLSEDENELELSYTACLSVLATRAQMGQTSVDVASELVSAGYANLIHYYHVENAKAATIGFFPDPVCAYLAMLIMVFLPRDWAELASKIFSVGLCHPDKGNVGEFAVALYCLLCGDVLRMAIDKEMKHFAVPLMEWMSLLAVPRKAWSSETLRVEGKPCVSFIQVCRNYLRLSLKDLVEGLYLREWFEAGIAFYSYPNCPVYDIIAPIRYIREGEEKYCPMLIRVKNHNKYSKVQVSDIESSMRDLLNINGISVGICVLVLTGMQTPLVDNNANKIFENLEENGIQFVTIAVPEGDCFGVWNLAVNTSTSGGPVAEIYASHLVVHQSASCLPESKLLRSRPKKAVKDFFDELITSFKS